MVCSTGSHVALPHRDGFSAAFSHALGTMVALSAPRWQCRSRAMGSFSRSEPLPSPECLVRLSEKVTIPEGVTLPVTVEVVGRGKGHCLASPRGPPASALHDEVSTRPQVSPCPDSVTGNSKSKWCDQLRDRGRKKEALYFNIHTNFLSSRFLNTQLNFIFCCGPCKWRVRSWLQG